MIKTAEELRQDLGAAIRQRRVLQRLSQEEAATRAGMSLSSWKRMEAQGPSSVDHMIEAAFVLRCEEQISELFPLPAASSMEDLLKRQAAESLKLPKRAPRRKRTP
jgi:transcriptional regulator with XRE-family HTH domain